jgi:hypothetical protein
VWYTDQYGYPIIWTTYIDLVHVKGGWQVQSYRRRSQDPESEKDITDELDTNEIDMIEPVKLPAHYSQLPQMGNPFIDYNDDDDEDLIGEDSEHEIE